MRDPERFPPIKPKHAAAIGYVAVHWSLIEEQLGFIIYSLLNLHSIPGLAAFAELNTLNRISTVATLVSLTGNQTWIDTWDDIALTINDLRNRRNDAVHSAWQVVGPDHWRTRVKAKGRLTIKRGLVQTTELQTLSDEILALWERIGDFTYSLLGGAAGKLINQFHPPGWPGKAPAQVQGHVPAQASPAHIHNPKRVRQQRRRKERRPADPKLSRAQRRAKALKAHKKK